MDSMAEISPISKKEGWDGKKRATSKGIRREVRVF